MMRRRIVVAASLLTLLFFPATAAAQYGGNTASSSRFTVGAYGGVASFDRFLEQRVDGLGERELTASTALTVGGSVGVRLGDQTGLRFAAAWSPTEFEFNDDGAGGAQFEGNDGALADLNLYTFSLEVLRFFMVEGRFAPYTFAGLSGALWSLDGAVGETAVPLRNATGRAILSREDDTQFRFGGKFGVGLQFRATPSLLIRLEASNSMLGNPFDGEDAFRVASGQTFDEPDIVRVNRLTLGLAYAIGGGGY